MCAIDPTMMLGIELISVRSPPMLVRSPSVSRKPRRRSGFSSFRSETAEREPTMIIAVTLLSTALNTTVMPA